MKLSVAVALCVLALIAMAGFGVYPRRVDTHEVSVINFAFEPARLSVLEGDIVVWSVVSGTHSATSDTGVWDSGLMDAPSQFQRSFGDPGEFPYYCMPHDFMRGSVTVEEADRVAVIAFWSLAVLSAGLVAAWVSAWRKTRSLDDRKNGI